MPDPSIMVRGKDYFYQIISLFYTLNKDTLFVDFCSTFTEGYFTAFIKFILHFCNICNIILKNLIKKSLKLLFP